MDKERNGETDAQFLPVLKIQRFSTSDGPGIRTTVFLKGCPLHCKWCHNPESQSVNDEFFFTPTLCTLCGKCATVCKKKVHILQNGTHTVDRSTCNNCMRCTNACISGAIERCMHRVSIDDVWKTVEKDLPFYEKKGGLTVSGGEPLLHTEKLLPLLEKAKRAKVSTVIETCGAFDARHIPQLKPLVDLFLYDIKDTDEARHAKNTGSSFRKIKENLLALDAAGAKTKLRCILIRGENDCFRHIENIVALYKTLKNCTGVEFFPYHHYGAGKYASLGLEYLWTEEKIPETSFLKEALSYAKKQGVRCTLHSF